MLADLSSIYLFSSIITGIVATLTLVITLAIVAKQTTHTAKQTELNTIISYHQYYKDVALGMLQHNETAVHVIGMGREDALAAVLLITLELAFKLHKRHLTDEVWWKSDEATTTNIMKQEYMRRYWESIKHVYHKEFAQFIDNTLQELDRQKQIALATNAKTEEDEKK